MMTYCITTCQIFTTVDFPLFFLPHERQTTFVFLTKGKFYIFKIGLTQMCEIFHNVEIIAQ